MRTGSYGHFVRDRRAISAVEFALVFPVLLILMLGGIQLITYINAVRKVELLASSISEMISQATPSSSQSTLATVNQLDVHFSYDSGLVIFPYLMKDAVRQNIAWWQNITIDYASIQFTQIKKKNCSGKPDQSSCYNASVVWTSTGTVGSNNRPCGTIQNPYQTATTSTAPSFSTLPATVYGPGSLIVIDVVFKFTPTFGSRFFKGTSISRSVYVQPRYATLINFDTTNNDGIVTVCPPLS